MNVRIELAPQTGDYIIRLPNEVAMEARLVGGDVLDVEVDEPGVVILTRIT